MVTMEVSGDIVSGCDTIHLLNEEKDIDAQQGILWSTRKDHVLQERIAYGEHMQLCICTTKQMDNNVYGQGRH